MNLKPIPLFKNNDNIEEGISEQFEEVIKKCKHPHIICIYGDSRTGKSTKMNQIINGTISENYFELKGPFKPLREIHTTMTKGCDLYGPIKVEDIAKNNNIDINECNRDIIDNELFFVDTEGLKSIDNTTKSCISGILTILQVSSIKILYTPFLDNEKFEDIVKNSKLSNILNISINESKIIVLIRDVQLNENKNERRMLQELDRQKNIFEEKINKYIQNIDGDITTISEILPSYELAANNIEPYPNCYKEKMKDLVLSILTNISLNREMNGQKLIDIIKEFLEIFKKVKDIEFMKNTQNALNFILLELFEDKVNKIYLKLKDKISKFDKNIISLNGKPESIKNFLIENIKNELRNTWEIFDKTIHNDIIKQLEKFSQQLEYDIKETFNKEKDKITNETYSITNINNHNEIINYLNHITYQEEVDQNKIMSIFEKIINTFVNKYKIYFEYIELTNNNYKNELIKYIKNNLNNNLKLVIDSKPKWEDKLRYIIFDIQSKISNPYKNDLKRKSKEELKKHLDNNLELLRKKIQLYIAEKDIKIFKVEDFDNEINYLFEAIKEEFSNQIKFIEGKINEELLKKEKIYSRSILDGIYLIYPAHCQNKVLDISGGSKDDNAILQVYDFNDTNAQKFQITYNNSKKYYSLMCLCSDKYISFDQYNYNIVQLTKNNNKNQQWHIISIGNNYEIISESNGKLMDIFGGDTSCGAFITTSERTGELNQQFKFVTTTKTPPPSSAPQPQSQPIPSPVPPPPVSYFPIPNFHHPYSDRNSIVDALKSIGVNSSLQYRILIGQRNGIPGRPGQCDFNIRMLNLLKSGKLIIP